MKTLLSRPWLTCLIVASLLFHGCDCGGQSIPCTSPSDCAANQACSAGFCRAISASDGSVIFGGGTGSTGGGGTGAGTGTGGGTGGSQGTGGASGTGGGTACVNLQCQQMSCPSGTTTSVSGVVYEPAGNLPLYNATVYIPNAALAPFTPGVSCDQCGASISGQPLSITLTDSNGHFKLENVPVGTNIPLVIQLGRWRRQVQIPMVSGCTDTALTDKNLTRLPRSKAEGDLPQMAIATGSADAFECLLLKMGIDVSEFTGPAGTGRVHYYINNGYPDQANQGQPGRNLYGTSASLSKYDVVFLPCEGQEIRRAPAITKNLVDYATAGGRIFSTHFSYSWLAYGSAPFPSTAMWQPDADRPPDPASVLINQAFPKGMAFNSWLQGVGAASGGMMSLAEARHDVAQVNPGTTAWLKGNWNGLYTGDPSYNWTPHLTFNVPFNPPPQADGGAGVECGRVVFSDFHVTAGATTMANSFPAACRSNPYTAQEKALVFMVFDLSSCITSDMKPPEVCKPVGGSCTSSGECCPGLACLNGQLQPCNGGTACTCSVTIG
jgi:hypothetical protein